MRVVAHTDGGDADRASPDSYRAVTRIRAPDIVRSDDDDRPLAIVDHGGMHLAQGDAGYATRGHKEPLLQDQALSARCEVSAILMRQLLPTRLYPGHARVGAAMSALALPPTVRRVDGVDWFWVPTLGRALWLLAHRRISSMTSLCSSVRPPGRVYASMIKRLRRERGVSPSLVIAVLSVARPYLGQQAALTLRRVARVVDTKVPGGIPPHAAR